MTDVDQLRTRFKWSGGWSLVCTPFRPDTGANPEGLTSLLYPGPRSQWLIFILLTSSAFAGASGSLGGSLLYELGELSRLRMGYGQELEGASLFAAS